MTIAKMPRLVWVPSMLVAVTHMMVVGLMYLRVVPVPPLRMAGYATTRYANKTVLPLTEDGVVGVHVSAGFKPELATTPRRPAVEMIVSVRQPNLAILLPSPR